jgi:hypothetical protein
VYGAITALVVIGALDGENLGSPGDAILVVIGTAFATWLAHAFAAVIGIHVRERHGIQPHQMATALRHTWRIVTAAIPITAVLVLADIGAIPLRSALSLATIIGILELLGVAMLAAQRSKFTLVGIVAYATVATAIGLIIVAIEIAVFH